MPKKGHTEEQIIAALQAAGSGREDDGHLPQAGDQPGDVLLVEAAVCRVGRAGATRTAAAAGGERAAEADCGRSHAGPADPAGDRLKKVVKPRQRRRLARWAQEAYQISERRAARILAMAWSTHALHAADGPLQEAFAAGCGNWRRRTCATAIGG